MIFFCIWSRNPFDDASTAALFCVSRRTGSRTRRRAGGNETGRFPDLTFSPLAGDLQAVGKKHGTTEHRKEGYTHGSQEEGRCEEDRSQEARSQEGGGEEEKVSSVRSGANRMHTAFFSPGGKASYPDLCRRFYSTPCLRSCRMIPGPGFHLYAPPPDVVGRGLIRR